LDYPSISQEAAAARRMCQQAASLARPLDLERWASSLLGKLWLRRSLMRPNRRTDPAFVLGERIVESFAAHGGSAGKTALVAVGRVDRGPLGSLARDLAASLEEVATPDWIAQVGTATVVRAFAQHSPGDGEALLLETDNVGESAHMVAAFINDRLDGIATTLTLTRPVDPSTPEFGEDGSASGGGLRFRAVDPVLACRRVRAAIGRTERALGAPVGDDFVEHRALAIARTTRPGLM
jgi:hypothetical protein